MTENDTERSNDTELSTEELASIQGGIVYIPAPKPRHGEPLWPRIPGPDTPFIPRPPWRKPRIGILPL